MKIICVIIAVLLVVSAAGAYVLSRVILQANRQTLEEAIAWQKDHYDISWFDGIDTDEYTVTGYEGYVLHVMLCRNPVVSDKYIIISHGHTDNRYGDLKYMKMYLDLGFNCVVYDLRGHGENENPPRPARGVARERDHGERARGHAGRRISGGGLRVCGYFRGAGGRAAGPDP